MIKAVSAVSVIAVLLVGAATASAGTTLDVYFDNDTPGHSGNSVELDRGYLNVYVSCQSTDVSTCRGKVTLTSKKGKKIGTGTFENDAGNAGGVGIKVASKFKGATVKACAKESTTSAKDCGSIKIKK